jgi:hypothetical protein
MKGGRMRSDQELEPFVKQLAEDTGIVERLRAAVGSGNRELVTNAINEITVRANSLDPTFASVEGVTITILFVRRLGL